MKRRNHILAAAAIFFVGTFLGMAAYRGGSKFYPDATTYSLSQNFFSDLGMRFGYSNQPISIWINLLFGISLVAAGIGGALYFAEIRETFKSEWNKRFGAILTLLFLGCIAAVPLIPSDRYTWPHRYLVVAAVFFLAASSVLAAFSTSLRGWRRISLAVYAALSSLYLIGILIAPLPASSFAARTGHAIAQKVIIFGFVGLYTVWVLHKEKERA